MIASIVRRLLIALLGLGFVLAACGGGSTPGMRVKLSDLSFRKTGGAGHLFRGSCPPGRLVVDYRPEDEIAFKSKTRLVTTLSISEAFIGCSDARTQKAPRRPPRRRSYIFPRIASVTASTRLVCMTTRRIEIIVAATYGRDAVVIGGEMVVWTPPATHQRRGRLLVAARVTNDRHSELTYHAPRCRISGGG